MPKRAPGPAVLHARETVAISSGALRFVVVSDTHGRPHPALEERIAGAAPGHILHAGDVGGLDVLARLRKHAPVTVVRGNVDPRTPELPDVVTLDVRGSGATLLKILLVHAGVNGVKLRADVARLARSEGASLVVCGHSHVPFAGHDRELTVFNPGSAGPRRFRLPVVLGVIDVSEKGASVQHVSCQTGAPWTGR